MHSNMYSRGKQGFMRCNKRNAIIYKIRHSAELTRYKLLQCYANIAGAVRHTPEETRIAREKRECMRCK